MVASTGIKPNQISVLSLVFAAAAAASLVCSHGASGWRGPALLLMAALGIQLRLLCNMLDGMVAVEGGHQSRSGEVFNDLPDRLADSWILVSLGYSIPTMPHAIELGWLAGLLAVFTAYVRMLGGACGASQFFVGPMAKQHRMALTTGALILAAGSGPWGYREPVLYGALVLLCVGSAITALRRTRLILQSLEGR
jgi:phosphatidylglycerophosphate synthase